MDSVFRIDELSKLLKDFYRLARIRITVFDSELNELVSYPEMPASFCRIIRSVPEGRAACAQCDRNACKAASKQNKTHIYRCHAGLTEAIMPLRVGGTLAGYLLFGHIFAYDSWQEGLDNIGAACADYPLDMEKLLDSVAECPHVSSEYILSAAKILHATASYLVMERMATLREESLAERLDRYLSGHYTSQITVDELCSELGIGRSRLYKLSSQLYGCGISEHIRDLRIEHAKYLLAQEGEMRIMEIAFACGFSDYNYFIAVFSKHVGISPNKYRRTHFPQEDSPGEADML